MTVHERVAAIAGRHAVILCHPDPHSFSHGVANAYSDAVRAAGQQVALRDLYALNFDPVLRANERPTLINPIRSRDVTAELDIISGSHVFVLIYPIWFGTPPAMMKGYIERVLGSEVSPEAAQHQISSNLLGGKRLLSFTTSAATNIWLSEQGQEQGLRSVLDQYLVHAFGYGFSGAQALRSHHTGTQPSLRRSISSGGGNPGATHLRSNRLRERRVAAGSLARTSTHAVKVPERQQFCDARRDDSSPAVRGRQWQR